tara:strand:+ start:24227 stop:24904 length:678 start_codon:yes stop_codon:yes gene_type:complete
MIYNEEYNWVYFRNWKVGSTTTIAVLKEAFPNTKEINVIGKQLKTRAHPDYEAYKKIIDKLNNPFTFGTVRNPFFQVQSIYYYAKRVCEQGGWAGFSSNGAEGALLATITFPEFIDACYTKHRTIGFVKDFIEPQWKLLQHVNKVIKFEALEKDLKKLIKELGGQTVKTFPHLNKKPPRFENVNFKPKNPIWVDYDKKSLQQVKEIYKDDLLYFNYAFPFENLIS